VPTKTKGGSFAGPPFAFARGAFSASLAAMIARLLFLLALLLAPAAAAAQSPPDASLEGSWVLKMDGTAIFRFDLAHDAAGHWQVTWSKPGSFASDGNHFNKIAGPAVHVQAMTAIDLPDGVEASFDDPHPGAIPDIFDFQLIDPDAVKMTYVGTGLPPYTLERVAAGSAIGPWDAQRTYARDVADKKSEKAPEVAPPADPDSFKLPPGAPKGR
jgi:hypothetical protein